LADLTVAGGTVYTPEGPRQADVHVSDGAVRAVEPWGSLPPAGEIVDARGVLVLPGAVDMHVHSRDPGFPEKEDFDSLTAAAAAGGTTTVVDMPNTIPGVDRLEAFESKLATVSSRARVDFALWGLLRSGSQGEELEALAEAGAVGFKAFLGYAWRRGSGQVTQVFAGDDPDLEPPPDYGTLARLAPQLRRWSLPLAVHAEDVSVLSACGRPLRGYGDLLAARPPLAEAVAVAAVGETSLECGIEVHVVHLSSRAGLRAARDAIKAGARMTLETCPQYLWLTDADYARLGTPMKVYPPIRQAGDRKALREGLFEGLITIVATDHAPHTDAEKALGLDRAPAGSPGVQTLLLSSLQLASDQDRPELAAKWVSENPARRLGLWPRKGCLQPGADADLVLVDPKGRTVVGPEQMLSKQRHGSLAGMAFDFAIRAVYSRGEQVAAAGRVTGSPGRGRLVRPGERSGSTAAPARGW
jgi:allantoinase